MKIIRRMTTAIGWQNSS